MGRFFVDPDIARAWTLPSQVYTDPAVFAEQREKVFARSWQWIGDESLVKVPGQVNPFILLEGTLDEPLVLTRDLEDRVHCLSNVCTHRGNLVVEAGGNERYLRCRYHGRRFGLDGCFQHMPEFDGVEGFPSERDDLPRLPLETWGPHLFVSLEPALSFEEFLGPVRDRLAWLPLEEFVPAPERRRDYLVRANWALYCDNYLEGFHIPFIHAGLNAVIDYGQYEVELFPSGSLQLAIASDAELAFELPASSPDAGRRVAAYYYWLFPNLMLNFYPWGLSVNVVRPLAVDLTKVSFFAYVWHPDKLEQGAGAALDRVEREDEVVVEATHRGVRSRLYDRGRYSVAREGAVHHFHRLLAEALG